MKRIVTTSAYCKQVFGEKLYKLTLSAATSCPNRVNGKGGCIFCSAGGSGEFAAPSTLTVDEQIEYAKSKIRSKYRGERFIAYFQSYSGTYGDLSALEQIYMQTVRRPDIAAISIATRPDCLGQEVMDLLGRISSEKPLWIELGLQSESDDTAAYIQRGYPFSEYVKGIRNLRTLPIHIITHVILGLPGEDREQMLRSVTTAGRYSDGLKLQLLHILKGTPLAQQYAAGQVTELSREAYYSLVADGLELLPEGKVIHRMTGDGDKRILIAPQWSADKKRVLGGLHAYLKQRGMEVSI